MANGPVAANVPGGALAVGSRAKANGRLTVALGIGAEANSDAAVAIGGSAAANATHSVALGVGSIADRANTVSVGRSDAQRQITNVKAGTAGTDAVNVQQLNAAVKAAAGTGSRYVKVNDGTGAIAGDAVATGTGSIAVGPASNAGGDFATAIGQKAGADEGSAAIGYQATASGTRSVAMGFGAHTNANANSVALGSFASGEGTGAVAVGAAARAAQDGIATGHAAVSAATDGIAVGRNATAGGTAANGATVGSGSIAIGADSYATYLGTVAIGRGATAGQKSAVALGMDSVADRSSTVSVGRSEEKDANGTVTRSAINRQIANVADGTADTDATTVSQLKGVASAIGGGAGVNADGTIKAPTFDLANGGKQTTVGGALSALDTATTQLNTKMSDATKYIKIKAKNADGEAVATGARDIAIGGGAIADAGSAPGMNPDNYSMAVGASAVAKGGGSVALGGGATVGSDETKAQAINGTALGAGTRVTATNAVALGADSVADRANTVSVGAGGRQRQIANVKAGTAGKDATNVDQLTASVNALGGGAKLDAATGAVTGPTYDLANGGKQTTVGGALSALDTATTKNAGDIANVKGDVTNITTNIANGTVGLVQQDPTSKAITVAKDKDGTSVSITGTAGDRTLAGVKAGTANTDAVNVGQLNDAVKAAAGTGSRYVKVNDGTGAIAGDAVATGTGSIAVGPASRASASYATAIGQNAGADEGSAAIGYQASASGARSVAMGFGAHTNANANSVALGSNSSADGAEALALGAAAHAAQAGIAAGSTAVAVATDSIAVGRNARAGAANGGGTIGGGSIAIGADSSTWYQGNVAIGQGASTKQTSTVALGMDSIADRTNTVSVGRAEVRDDKGEVTTSAIKRQVVNVAAGTQATDATNVEQLTASVNALGGGAKLDTTTGAVTGPTYDLANGGKQTTVGGALSALDTATTKNAGDIANVKGDVTNITTNIANGTVGLVQQDPTSKAITVAKDKDGTSVSLTGTAGDRTLTGLGAGLADNSAVNLAQLKSAGFDFDAKGNVTNSAVTYTAGTIASGSPHIVLSAGQGDSPYFVDGDRSKGKLPKGTIISNVATGKQDTDAANVGQVYDIMNQVDQTDQSSDDANAIQTRAMPGPTSVSKPSWWPSNGSIGQGINLRASTDSSGVDVTGLTKSYKTAAYYAQASGLGDSVGSTGPSDMARAEGKGSLAFGSNAYASTDKSAAIGVHAYTSAADSVALGAGSVANQANTVSVGSDGTGSYTAVDANGQTYTIQNGANTRRVVNMAAGHDDTDAVNVSQLKGVTSALGGGAAVNVDGTIKAPTFSVQGGTQTTVADALGSLDTATTKNTGDISNVTNTVNNITNGAAGLVQQDPTSKQITVAKDKDGTSVSFAGTTGERTLTGLSDGVLSATSTDAVTGSQLYATNEAVKKNTGDIGSLSQKVNNINTNIGNVGNMVTYDNAQHDSLTLGGLKDDGKGGQVPVTKPVKVSNVAAGTAASDASTVGQLSPLVDALGGGAKIDSTTGAVTGPTYTVQGTTQTTVGGAVTALDSATTKNASDIVNVTNDMKTIADNITNGKTGLVQQDDVTKSITVAKSLDGDNVDFTGTGGTRELTGVSAGKTDSSAATVGQLRPVVNTLGGGAAINADGSIVAPTYTIQGKAEHNVGDAFKSVDDNLASLKTQIGSGGIGIVTQDATTGIINVGGTLGGDRVNIAGTGGDRVLAGVAPGAVNAKSNEAVNGSQAYNNASSVASALGGGSTVNPDGTITAPSFNVGGTTVHSVGDAVDNIDGRVTQNTNAISGMQSKIDNVTGQVANAVQYDSSAHDKVTLGDSTKGDGVKVSNVADGQLSETSRDAVNGSQLFATNSRLNSLNDAMKAATTSGSPGVSINTDKGPAKATGAASVAIGGGSLATGSNATAIGDGASATGAGAVALGQGSVADQANTVSVGSQGNERRITNVAPGQAPTDAVNMSQFNQGLGDVARSAYSGIAAATALTMIPDVDPGKTIAVGIGTANFKGYQAGAIGASARITQNLKVKVGAGLSAAGTTVGGGMSYQW